MENPDNATPFPETPATLAAPEKPPEAPADPQEPTADASSVDLFPESVPPPGAAEMVAPFENPAGAQPDGTAQAPEKGKRRGRPIIHGKFSKFTQPGQTDQPPQQPQASEVPNFDKILPPTPPPAVSANVNYDELAGMLFDMGTGALSALLGPEWQPQGKEERKAIIGPLAAYLRTKEIKDIPPNVALTIAVCAYAAPRCFQPNTRGKLAAAWGWTRDRVKLAWAWFKVTFKRKKQ